MNLETIWVLGPKLMPLMPRISKAIATIERLMNDPEVKDALAVAEQVSTMLKELPHHE